MSRLGAIRVLAGQNGWSLPALAAETGAVVVYRIERGGTSVRVEAWSQEGTYSLQRNLAELPMCVRSPGPPSEFRRTALLPLPGSRDGGAPRLEGLEQ